MSYIFERGMVLFSRKSRVYKELLARIRAPSLFKWGRPVCKDSTSYLNYNYSNLLSLLKQNSCLCSMKAAGSQGINVFCIASQFTLDGGDLYGVGRVFSSCISVLTSACRGRLRCMQYLIKGVKEYTTGFSRPLISKSTRATTWSQIFTLIRHRRFWEIEMKKTKKIPIDETIRIICFSLETDLALFAWLLPMTLRLRLVLTMER